MHHIYLQIMLNAGLTVFLRCGFATFASVKGSEYYKLLSVFSHDSSMDPWQPIGPPLKYLNSCWIDCHGILFVPRGLSSSATMRSLFRYLDNYWLDWHEVWYRHLRFPEDDFHPFHHPVTLPPSLPSTQTSHFQMIGSPGLRFKHISVCGHWLWWPCDISINATIKPNLD